MTAPTDFDSFAFGFDLKNSAYSGGAGGTFDNLVTGGEDWAVNGGTPSFSTKSGSGWSLEGMDFAAAANGVVKGEHRALYESTIIVIGEATVGGIVYPYGGTYASGNSFAAAINGKVTVKAYNATGSSPYTAVATQDIPHVFCVSFSPQNGTTYAQIDDGTVVSLAQSAGSFENARTNWMDAMIGGHRTSYFTGWIARVLVFSRALHYRDNTNLQSLITTEMAKIGL